MLRIVHDRSYWKFKNRKGLGEKSFKEVLLATGNNELAEASLREDLENWV